MMGLDDGAAHRESDPHAIALGRIERFEELVRALRPEADSSIRDAQAHVVAHIQRRFDDQLPGSILNSRHRLRGIAYQVEDDLLQLDAIAGDRGSVSASSDRRITRLRRRSLSDRAITSWVASFRSGASSVNSLLLYSARRRRTTSEARLPSRRIRRAVSRAPSGSEAQYSTSAGTYSRC